MGKIKLDKTKLNKAIAQSFQNMTERLSDCFDESMDDDLYEYPRTTKRRSGEIAGSPRSITDLGNLRDSKIVTRSSTSNAVEFGWEEDYAAAVHNGYTTRNGAEVPPRPWTEVGIQIAQPVKTFEKELKRNL